MDTDIMNPNDAESTANEEIPSKQTKQPVDSNQITGLASLEGEKKNNPLFQKILPLTLLLLGILMYINMLIKDYNKIE